MAGYVAASPGIEASSGEKAGEEAGGLALCRPWVAKGLQLCRVSSLQRLTGSGDVANSTLILFWSASVPLPARVGRWGGGEAVFGSPDVPLAITGLHNAGPPALPHRPFSPGVSPRPGDRPINPRMT